MTLPASGTPPPPRLPSSWRSVGRGPNGAQLSPVCLCGFGRGPSPSKVWALSTDVVLSKPPEITVESTATPPNTPQKQRPLEVAGKLVIDRCERPLVDACQRELKMEVEWQLWRWKADISLIGSEQSCRKCVAESATVSIRSLGINHMGRNTGECHLG